MKTNWYGLRLARTLVFSATLLGALLAVGCSTPVSKDYNPTVDFSRYENIHFLPADRAENSAINQYKAEQPLQAQRIKIAIEDNLKAKGISINRDPANGYISYHVQTQSYMAQDPVSIGFGIGTFGRHGGIMFGANEPLVEQKEYSLVIDVYDPNYQVVWRGKTAVDFSLAQNPQESMQMIQAAVQRVLENFPPKK